jgi:hypothetical protein
MEAVLIATSDCHLCERARDILRRLAEGRPLGIKEIAWEEPAAIRLVERDGIPFPPVIYLDGRFAAYGRVSEGALRRRLDELAR